jgi:predicted dehydrogenase
VRSAVFRRRCGTPNWGGWLGDPSKSGGGAFDLLIHDIDMCVHLFGTPEAVSATGYLDPGRADSVTAQLFYRDGLTVLVTGGWHPPSTFPFSMEFTVTFENGTMDFSSGGRPLTVFAVDGGGPGCKPGGMDGYTAEIQYFVDCCREGKAPEICPPDESAAAVKLMRAILEARERNGEKIPCRI